MSLVNKLPIPFQLVLATVKENNLIKAYIEGDDEKIIWRRATDHEIISEDNIVGWVGLDDYLFTDSRQVLLSHSNISIDDELMIFNEDHHYIALNCVWALWFDVDKYFGVKTHEYDSVYVNFYTNWSPYDGLKAYITLQGDNSEMYFDWELTEIEKKLLIEKLDSYTRSKTGMNLYDYYNKENSQT